MSVAKVYWVIYGIVASLGGALGDLFSQPYSEGGLGAGQMEPTLLAMAVIVIFIPYMAMTREGAKVRYIHFDYQ